VKFDLKFFGGETDVEKLNQWLKQLKVFFIVQMIEDNKKNIDIVALKLEGHTLVLWEAYCDVVNIFYELFVTSWRSFKELLQGQLYPLGHK